MSGHMLFAGAILLIAGLWHVVPVIARRDLFFAVTVGPEFRRTPEARRIVRRYRAITWSSAAVAIVLHLSTGVAFAAALVLGGGFMWALVSAHGRALAYAVRPNPAVEVDLSAPPEGLPGGAVAAALPVLFVCGAGVWAALHWDHLPPRFPVHWGLHGPDRWVTTTPATVFGFLAVEASICLLLVGIAAGVLHWSRRISTAGPSAAAERRFRRQILMLLIVVEYFVACPAWFALFHPSGALVNVWALELVSVIVVFIVMLLESGQGGNRRIASGGSEPIGDRTPDACWKWGGLLYVNLADPSIIVERRIGIGYTLNFGNRSAWLVLALLLSPLVIAWTLRVEF